MIDKHVMKFSEILSTAGFRNFTIQDTKKPKNIIMTKDQEIKELKERLKKCSDAYLEIKSKLDKIMLVLK